MRTLSLIFFLLFVSVLMHGKIKHSSKISDYNKVSDNKFDNPNRLKAINNSSQKGKIIKRKKEKTKGLSADNVMILNSSINQIYNYKVFLIQIINKKYGNFSHCNVRKRGPPFI
jgi:hypothetical protein